MRIIAGKHRGRKISCPPGKAVRPTSDRVKESLFSILGPSVEEVDVLDCFAGSGNLGLEALSRGAKRAVFVEKAGRSLAAIRKNVETLGEVDSVQYLRADIEKEPRERDLEKLTDYHFEVVFIDPPYPRFADVEFWPRVERWLREMPLADEAIISIERPSEIHWHCSFTLWKEKEYGDKTIGLYCFSRGESEAL